MQYLLVSVWRTKEDNDMIRSRVTSGVLIVDDVLDLKPGDRIEFTASDRELTATIDEVEY